MGKQALFVLCFKQGVVGRGMSRTALIVDATVSPAATVAGQGTKRLSKYKYPTIVMNPRNGMAYTVTH